MRRLLFALALLLAPLAARAQEAAALASDSLFVTEQGLLVLEGHVQAFYRGAVLSAPRVTYDRAADRLVIDGPIVLRDPDGNVLTAEAATLDPRLRDGLLRGVRLVLDRRLQIAAGRLDRQGDVSALTAAAATSCQVCPGRRPLWEIRADQVIHDESARQLWFRNARFLVRGVPLLWVPRLRLPDPTNDRATGLLIPRLRRTGELGFGIELPYFVVLGPTRDLTVTPYLAAGTRTLGARFRQALPGGGVELRGALSRDDLREGLRGYLALEGALALADRTRVAFDLSAVSDDRYPADYDLASGGRLESLVTLERVAGRTLLEAELLHTRALRDGTDAPRWQGGLAWERRAPRAGGWLDWGGSADAVAREDGRDTLRAGAFARWQGGTVVGPGLLADGEARLAADAWRVDDSDAEGSYARLAPAVQAVLRWPLLRRAGGTADLLEPVVSLGWTGALGEDPPDDEDSRLPELDGANLHALSRLPGEDRVEPGARLALGLAWTRTAPGWESRLAFGRLLRAEPFAAGASSGLDGTRSDWLAEARLALGDAVELDARALLGDGLAPGRAEARLGWALARGRLDLGWTRLPADAAEERDEAVDELTLDLAWEPDPRWTLTAGARQDLDRGRLDRLDLGATWRNECVEVDVTFGQSYTDAGDGGSTDVGLSVDLLGFSAGDARVTPGACRR